MRPKLQKQSALKFAGRIMPPSGGEQSREAEGNETKTSIMKCIEVF